MPKKLMNKLKNQAKNKIKKQKMKIKKAILHYLEKHYNIKNIEMKNKFKFQFLKVQLIVNNLEQKILDIYFLLRLIIIY